MGVYETTPQLHSLELAAAPLLCSALFTSFGAIQFKSPAALPSLFQQGGSAGGDLHHMAPQQQKIAPSRQQKPGLKAWTRECRSGLCLYSPRHLQTTLESGLSLFLCRKSKNCRDAAVL